MEVIEIRVDDLIPYANNPRNNDGAVDAVANSIKEFGFQQPLVVDKNNILVVGHTRLKAAKKLGFKTVPCVVADDLTEAQINAYRLADNKTNELAEWNGELLEAELEGLPEFDMSLFGFDPVEEVPEVVEDEFDESIEDAPMRAHNGDIWELGKHRLMCGDSSMLENIEKLTGGQALTLF